MYLLENTEEAQEMRQKVRDLLTSDYEPNVLVAFAIIQTGGCNLELFPYLWSAYCKKKRELQEYEETVQAMIQAIFPEKIQAYILAEIGKLQHDYWRSQDALFANIEFFQLLIEEGLTTLEELQRRWETETFYRARTSLTRFLLENKVAIDKRFFLSPDLPAHLLRIHGLDFLFEDDDPNFDKRAFLKRFIEPITPKNPYFCLNLSHTGLKTLPAEVLELQGLEVLDIQGTQIRDLPHQILATVKDIRANQKTKRKIYGKILSEKRFDYFYAQYLAYRKAETLHEGKRYAEALAYYAASVQAMNNDFFVLEQKTTFWQNYFHSAFMAQGRQGDLVLSEQIFQKALADLPYPKVFHWAHLTSYFAYFYCTGIEKTWLTLLEDYAQNSNPAHTPRYSAMHHLGLANVPHLGYVYDYGWRVMHEQAIYKGFIEGAVRILQRARQAVPDIQAQHWHWVKLFRHLQFIKDYASIVYLFELYETDFMFNATTGELQNDRLHRCVWIWVEALVEVGKLDRAEALCSYHIQYFQKQAETREAQQNRYYSPYYSALYSANLAYKYLIVIYGRQGRLACVDRCRQEQAIVIALIKG